MCRGAIHPIVSGTEVFEQGMMTHRHAHERLCTIPLYCRYLEGGDRRILFDTGAKHPIQSEERKKAIGGKIHAFESAALDSRDTGIIDW